MLRKSLAGADHNFQMENEWFITVGSFIKQRQEEL